MDSDEYQLDFPPDGAVRQWRLLTANGGQRLQKEFAVKQIVDRSLTVNESFVFHSSHYVHSNLNELHLQHIP